MPEMASVIARFTATLLFPTPPFPLSTETERSPASPLTPRRLPPVILRSSPAWSGVAEEDYADLLSAAAEQYADLLPAIENDAKAMLSVFV